MLPCVSLLACGVPQVALDLDFAGVEKFVKERLGKEVRGAAQQIFQEIQRPSLST